MQNQSQQTQARGEPTLMQGSTGNVFEDLGFSNAPELSLKADLAVQVRRIIRTQSITQTRAAQLTGLKAPDVSDVVNARLEGISVERLFLVLNKLGHNVEVRVEEEETENARTRLLVA